MRRVPGYHAIAVSSEPDATPGGPPVGRYVVLEELGRGGMGRVFRAYDPKLQREVALKEVRRDAIGSVGRQRLVAEARAMAKLSHPNVVAIYDVQEPGGGEVVLVMEYVAGRTLSAWLAASPPWTDVVPRFAEAGRGLAAAHEAGLLHRDFKPDNVLVGDDGRVRVTDFGLAHEPAATDAEATGPETDEGPAEPLLATAAGTIMGTLPYLAPERLTGSPANASTDQFAFCVSLWEGLYGARPYAGRTVIELAVAMSAGPPAPPADAPRVPGWLQQLVLRGLAYDADERWPDMTALVAALVDDPSIRRATRVRTLLGVGAMTSVGVAVQLWMSARTARCSADVARAHLEGVWDDAVSIQARTSVLDTDASQAEDAWVDASRRLDDYASEWIEMHVDACEAISVRGEQSESILDRRMACLQRARTELLAITGELRQTDAAAVPRLDELLGGLAPLTRCADIEALTADVEPPRPEDAEIVAAARERLAAARAAQSLGRSGRAREAVEAAKRLTEQVSYPPVAVEAALEEGRVLHALGRYEEAVNVLKSTLDDALGGRQWDAAQSAAAILVYVLGADLRRGREGLAYADLARGLADPGSSAEAMALSAIASVLLAEGRHDEAAEAYRAVLAVREHDLGPDDPDTAVAQLNLGAALAAGGRGDEAERAVRRGLATLRDAPGDHQQYMVRAHGVLGGVLFAQKKYEEAAESYRQALTQGQGSDAAVHADDAMPHINLGQIYGILERYDEAEVELRTALAISEAARTRQHPEVALVLTRLGRVVREQGRSEEAISLQREALAIATPILAPEHMILRLIRLGLADALREAGAFEEAREHAEAAWDPEATELPASLRASLAFALARTLVTGDHAEPARATELAERARIDAEAADDPKLKAKIDTWLTEHRG